MKRYISKFNEIIEIGNELVFTREESFPMLYEFMNGGKSKGIVPEDIDPEQLKQGIEVEYEHTANEMIARKIALDHLTEHPAYYSALKKMEEELDSLGL